MSYSELQNGSDIRGIALENETGEKVNLTEKSAQDIAGAFVRWLSAKTGKKDNAKGGVPRQEDGQPRQKERGSF